MKTSVADEAPYSEFCDKVMNDQTGELLKTFRRDPNYDYVVPGNRKGEEVFEHVELIKNEFPEMLEYMPIFEQCQGVFGNPTTHDFDIGTPGVRLDVPIPLHIYYLALTLRYFGHLGGMKICEIGPGAGLFFKLVTDLYPMAKYTFVDLQGPLYINRKHVGRIGRDSCIDEYLECSTLMGETTERAYDLVISDCAFNELHRDVQNVYIEKILNKSARGRIAFYNFDMNAVLPSMNILEVFNLLDRKSKIIKMDLRVPTLYWDETQSERWNCGVQKA